MVTSEIEDGVAVLTLSRPDALNALSKDMMLSLDGALDEIIVDDRVRAVVVTGSGKAFCAGGDLREFSTLLDADPSSLLETLAFNQHVLEKLEAVPVPVIAAVNGDAVAGGLELVLCCDVVLAATSARLGDGHANYSIIPAGGSTVRLLRKIPPNVAMHLLFSAELYPARDFTTWGLVNKVVPDLDLPSEAASLARIYARHSRRVLTSIKQLTRRNGAPVAELARLELEAFAEYLNHPDLANGLARFAERTRQRSQARLGIDERPSDIRQGQLR
jgi:enoyl-CoA hydratase